MQKSTAPNNDKIPLQFDPKHGPNLLQKNARQIFYLNEIKLTELQEELSSFCTPLKIKEITVKVYALFENLSYVFQKLGIEQLYQQLKHIFNAISKILSKNGPPEKQKKVQLKMMERIDEEITTKNLLNENNPAERCEIQKQNGRKVNRCGGIYLYNESYCKLCRHVQKNVDKQSLTRKKDIIDTIDKIDIQEEFQRQQMLYFMSRKKQLCIMKIKDHSKGYQQIQNQFRLVQQKVKIALENLQSQFEHENIQQFQFVSKEQISKQLLGFNQTMRNQLVILKDQYDLSIQTLRLQNIQLRNKINEFINAKNSLVSTETQTIETLSSIKKIKRLVEEYEVKMKRYEAKISESGKRQKQIEEKFTILLAKKDKELASTYENLSKKQELVNIYKMKCYNYEEMMDQNQDEPSQKINEHKDLYNFQEQIKQINEEGDRYKRGKRNNNHLTLKRRTLNSHFRNSQYSELSKSDQGEEDFNNNSKKIKPFSNQNFEFIKKNGQSAQGKMAKWNKNMRSELKEDTNISLPQRILKKQNLHGNFGPHSELTNEKAIIEQLKNGQISLSKQRQKKGIKISELRMGQMVRQKSENIIGTQNRIGEQIKEGRGTGQRKAKTLSVIQDQSSQISQISRFRISHEFKNSLSFSPAQNNELIVQIKKRQNKPKKQIQAQPITNNLNTQKFQKNQATTKLSKQSRFKVKHKNKSTHLQPANRDIPQENKNRNGDGDGDENRDGNRDGNRNGDGDGEGDEHNFGAKISPNVSRELKQNYQKYIAKLNLQQISTIADKLFQGGHINEKTLSEIAKEYPHFISEMKTFEANRAMYEALNRVHQKKCQEKTCHHLDLFVEFCNKLKEGINNSSRTVLKLHVQNFGHI